MAILINDNYSLQAENKAFDARYLDVNTPWASCAAAIAGIPTYRYPGLTINISNVEWWWKDGILDGDLEQKTLGGTSNLSGATNGLQLLCGNTYIGLGGALTQDTTICGAYGLGLGNIASGLTSISAVTPTFQIYDTGINSSLSFCHDQDTPHFDVCLYGENANSNADMVLDVDVVNGCFGVKTAPNTTCYSSLSLRATDSNAAIYNVRSTNDVMYYVNEVCMASSKLTCEALMDRGNFALNIKSVMNYDTRSFEFCKDNLTILSILSGGTARYGVATIAACITNDADLANKIYVDEAVDSLGAANGICEDGDNFVLGGSLTGDTAINLNSNELTFSGGSDFNVCGGNVKICPSILEAGGSSYSAFGRKNGGNYVCFEMVSGCGIKVIDNDIQKGLYYITDYCANGKTDPRWIPDNQYVTGLTSGITGAFTTANNGLCSSGQIVSLGGTLTGDTTIGGNSNVMTINNFNGFDITSVSATTCATTSMLIRTPSFTLHNGVDEVINISTTCKKFTDNDNNEGFVYDDNYCVAGKVNPRWIPDNQYVTGLTSGFFDTASNGLTKDLQDVKLGGTLCENTDICLGGGAASQTFTIKNSGTTVCSVLDMNGTTVSLCASNVNSPFQTGRVTVGSSGSVICSGFATCFSSIEMGNSIFNICAIGGSSNAYLRVTDDTSTPRGLEYAACYHSTYCDRSLTDKEYVDTCVNSLTGTTSQSITGATNGLCKVGQDVVLGGSLTGPTTINVTGQQLTFTGGTVNISNGILHVCGGQTIIENSVVTGIGVDNGADCACISMSAGGFTVVDSFTDTGFRYLNNYCAVGKTNPRWIPDNAYVTGQTSQAIISGTNVGGGNEVYSGATEQVASYRTIVGSGDTTVSTVGDKIIIHGSSGGTTTYDGQSPSAIDVGGIPSGTVISGCSFTQLWEDLLVPELYQTTVTAPTRSINLSPTTTLYEIGCSASFDVIGGFGRGQQIPAYCGCSPYRVGAPNTYCFSGAQIAGAYICTALSATQSVTAYNVSANTQTWGVCVDYDTGECPVGSKGTPNSAVACCPAGTIGAITKSISGYYPLWATCDDITTPLEKITTAYCMCTADNVVIELCGESVSDKQKFEVACDWLGAPTNRTLNGISWWNNLAGSWVAETGCWVMSSTTETVQGQSVGYCQYTYNGLQRGGICIRLEF